MHAAYEWWTNDATSTEATLAREALSQVLQEPDNLTSRQTTAVRAFEETQLGEFWKLHTHLVERTAVTGVRHDFESWFDSVLRHRAEAGSWHYPMRVLRQVQLRLFSETS